MLHRAALPDGGHLAKALEHILASYPRDDLFQIGEDELYDTALGILAAGERQRLRLFLWRDPYERFVSCLVYVPREAYSTELRKKFQAILMEAFAGQRADFGVLLGDTLLARVHFTIRTPPGQVPAYDRARDRSTAGRGGAALGRRAARRAGRRGRRGPRAWRCSSAGARPSRRCTARSHRARAAVPDVLKVDALTPEQPLGLSLYRPLGGSAHSLGFKVYRLGAPVVLSDSLPMLEHMGVRVMGEDNFRIHHGHGGGVRVSMHDFKLEAQVSDELEPEVLARLFEGAFAQVFRGEVENDDFNRLVLRAGLAADDIVVLRAYARYLQADRLRAVAGHDRSDAGGAAAHRAHAGQAVPPAPASAPNTTTTRRPRR